MASTNLINVADLPTSDQHLASVATEPPTGGGGFFSPPPPPPLLPPPPPTPHDH